MCSPAFVSLVSTVSGLTYFSNSISLQSPIFTTFSPKFHVSFNELILLQAFNAYQGQTGKISRAAGNKSIGCRGPDDLADKFRHFQNIVQAKQNFSAVYIWSLSQPICNIRLPNHVSFILSRSCPFVLSFQVFLPFQKIRPYYFFPKLKLQ